jgi:N-glycosylase/DNA lyase
LSRQTRQMVTFVQDGQVRELVLPAPSLEVLPGVPWGRADALFTPAYWLSQYLINRCTPGRGSHRIGKTFKEEVAACLLGGYGIPAEIGLAAFERLKRSGALADSGLSVETLKNTLRSPMHVGERKVRYRFWSQKSRYLVVALRTIETLPPPFESARALRQYLMDLPGIGAKTASWIVRNWLDSDEVAILDIHVIRACQLMGLFSKHESVAKDYAVMEDRFLSLAKAMTVPASNLDALIWNQMRSSPRLVASLLSPSPLAPRRSNGQPTQGRLQME